MQMQSCGSRHISQSKVKCVCFSYFRSEKFYKERIKEAFDDLHGAIVFDTVAIKVARDLGFEDET